MLSDLGKTFNLGEVMVDIPGHERYERNKKADELAKKAIRIPHIGPGPVCGVSKTAARRIVRKWVR